MFDEMEGRQGQGVDVDFTDVKDGFSPIPEGRYLATVINAEVKPNKAGDGKYINWTFKLQGGEHAGRQFWLTTSLKPQALWKLRDVLKALGMDVPKGAMQLDLPSTFGSYCMLDIVTGTWNEAERSEVRDVKPCPEGFNPEEYAGDDDLPF